MFPLPIFNFLFLRLANMVKTTIWKSSTNTKHKHDYIYVNTLMCPIYISLFGYVSYIYQFHFLISCLIIISLLIITITPSSRAKRQSTIDFQTILFTSMLLSSIYMFIYTIYNFEIISCVITIIFIILSYDLLKYVICGTISATYYKFKKDYNKIEQQGLFVPIELINKLKMIDMYCAHFKYFKLSGKHDTCSICIEQFNDCDYNNPNKLQLISCGHIFHSECLLQNEAARWSYKLDNKSYSCCPNCKGKYNIMTQRHNYCHNMNKQLFGTFKCLAIYLWGPIIKTWFIVFPDNIPTKTSIIGYYSTIKSYFTVCYKYICKHFLVDYCSCGALFIINYVWKIRTIICNNYFVINIIRYTFYGFGPLNLLLCYYFFY
eukprot:326838_1